MTNKQSVSTPDKAHKPEPKYDLKVLKEFPELYEWLKQVSRYCKVEDFVYISDYKEEDKSIRLSIFTKNNQYNLSAHLPKGVQRSGDLSYKDKGYLVGYRHIRKPRAGEDWNRGGDLPDGPYSEETWQKIKNNIISCELVKVVRHSPNK